MSNTINKLLHRRERSKSAQEKPTPSFNNLQGLFTDESWKDKPKFSAKSHEKKIKEVESRLLDSRIFTFHDEDIGYVLLSSYAKGDTEKAFELLSLLAASDDGPVRPYNPSVRLLGAVNRNNVSCYLDATLFAMFARLNSFEAMLYSTPEDEDKKRLSTLLRLWVNMLRVGKLITADFTKEIQEALARCDWEDARNVKQQDASEVFSRITEMLGLPMLTLKEDIFHPGKEDRTLDHKFVEERLLPVAVPEDPTDGTTITLEGCLEAYFTNNQIEVKRYLERKSTMNLRGNAFHVETAEYNILEPPRPSTLAPGNLPPPYSQFRPAVNNQNPSIIPETYVEVNDENSDTAMYEESISSGLSMRRPTMSTRKAVSMPAWQFFRLHPWYKNTKLRSDAKFAAHFSSTRPVVGVCLKRYDSQNGEAIRRDTHIDIPTEIALPHFVQDDSMDEGTTTFGNFKLSLQSVVCHRGNSVNAGHYVSIIRGQSSEGEENWLLFDDLNIESRIKAVDIERALSEESPYLLFYQVQPIADDPGNIGSGEQPPSYEPASRDFGFTDFSSGSPNGINPFEEAVEAEQPSNEGFVVSGRERGRSIELKERRRSIFFEEEITYIPKAESGSYGSSGLHSSRGPRFGSKLRKGSRGTDRRLSASFTRFAGKLASLGKHDPANHDGAADIVVAAAVDADDTEWESVDEEDREKGRLTQGGRPERECNIM